MSTNLNQNTESPKLKIAATVTHTENVDKEIELPYYFKNAYGNPCKIVSKDHFILIIPHMAAPLVSVQRVEYNKAEIAKGTPCTTDEFEAAYSQAMMYIDAIYRNEEPSTEADVNEEIDQILQDKIDGRAA